jgi:hypothetical protein
MPTYLLTRSVLACSLSGKEAARAALPESKAHATAHVGSISEHLEEQEHSYSDSREKYIQEKYPPIPELAERWLEELKERGGLPKRSSPEDQVNDESVSRLPLEDYVGFPSDPSTYYPARLDTGQVVWVRLDERRASNGYTSVQVAGKSAYIRAILAAVTILEGAHINIEKLRSLLPFTELFHPDGMRTSQREALHELVDAGEKAAADTLFYDLATDHLDYRSLNYAIALLRYFRPNFDTLPLQQQRGLLERCCERMNKLLEASRQLNEFLEYGSLDRDQRPRIENPHRDVEAAALRDVEDYTYREIAELLDIEISEKSRWVGDYSTVAKMVVRGREILKCAFGKKGWQEKVQILRARLERLESLSLEERFIEERAEEWGVSSQFTREVIVEGLNPTPEQAKSMEESGLNIEGARWFYARICGESADGDRV